MGLLEALLGANNPAAQWANSNSNFLGAIGAGLGQGQNIQSGLSAGLAAVPQAKALDRENAEKLKAEAKVEAQTNATKAWLEQNYPDLAQAVDAGLSVSDAWQEAFRRQSAGPEKPQNPYMSAGDGTFFNWQTGEYVSNPNAQPDTPNLPTSFVEWQLAQSNPEYAASLNSTTSRTTEGQRRNDQLYSVAAPQAEIVLENWDALTDPANQFLGTSINGSSPGAVLAAPAYQEAANALRVIAQSYLYSVSGAAATDAETQKIVDSVTPRMGESEASSNNKKALIGQMIEAIKAAGSQSSTPAAGGESDPFGIR
jgi:hypothetical protein